MTVTDVEVNLLAAEAIDHDERASYADWTGDNTHDRRLAQRILAGRWRPSIQVQSRYTTPPQPINRLDDLAALISGAVVLEGKFSWQRYGNGYWAGGFDGVRCQWTDRMLWNAKRGPITVIHWGWDS